MATAQPGHAAGPERRARRPAAGGRLRRQGAAGLGGHPRLHALRHLPAPVPDVPGARPGDGLPARPRVPDARRVRGPHRPDRELRPPHGPVPRLPRVRDRVPRRRAVRAPHRGDARADRAEGAAPARPAHPGQAPPGRVSRAAAARAAARPDAALSAERAPACRAGDRAPAALPAAPGDGAPPPDALRPAGGAAARPRRFRPAGARAGRSRCWRDASSRCSSPRSTARPCACWRAPGTASSCPQEQGCCGALHLHWGDRRAGRALARRNAGGLRGRRLDRHERRGLRGGAPRLRASPRG